MSFTNQQIENAVTASKTMMVGGASTTFGSRIWTWLGENHDAIASVCSILGLAICAAGFVLNIYINRKK